MAGELGQHEVWNCEGINWPYVENAMNWGPRIPGNVICMNISKSYRLHLVQTIYFSWVGFSRHLCSRVGLTKWQFNKCCRSRVEYILSEYSTTITTQPQTDFWSDNVVAKLWHTVTMASGPPHFFKSRRLFSAYRASLPLFSRKLLSYHDSPGWVRDVSLDKQNFIPKWMPLRPLLLWGVK